MKNNQEKKNEKKLKPEFKVKRKVERKEKLNKKKAQNRKAKGYKPNDKRVSFNLVIFKQNLNNILSLIHLSTICL